MLRLSGFAVPTRMESPKNTRSRNIQKKNAILENERELSLIVDDFFF